MNYKSVEVQMRVRGDELQHWFDLWSRLVFGFRAPSVGVHIKQCNYSDWLSAIDQTDLNTWMLNISSTKRLFPLLVQWLFWVDSDGPPIPDELKECCLSWFCSIFYWTSIWSHIGPEWCLWIQYCGANLYNLDHFSMSEILKNNKHYVHVHAILKMPKMFNVLSLNN